MASIAMDCMSPYFKGCDMFISMLLFLPLHHHKNVIQGQRFSFPSQNLNPGVDMNLLSTFAEITGILRCLTYESVVCKKVR